MISTSTLAAVDAVALFQSLKGIIGDFNLGAGEYYCSIKELVSIPERDYR